MRERLLAGKAKKTRGVQFREWGTSPPPGRHGVHTGGGLPDDPTRRPPGLGHGCATKRPPHLSPVAPRGILSRVPRCGPRGCQACTQPRQIRIPSRPLGFEILPGTATPLTSSTTRILLLSLYESMLIYAMNKKPKSYQGSRRSSYAAPAPMSSLQSSRSSRPPQAHRPRTFPPRAGRTWLLGHRGFEGSKFSIFAGRDFFME